MFGPIFIFEPLMNTNTLGGNITFKIIRFLQRTELTSTEFIAVELALLDTNKNYSVNL
jgi:hypothetical protein